MAMPAAVRLPADDVRYQNIVGRVGLVQFWARLLHEGAEAVGRHTPAGHRLAESGDFFDFLALEVPKAMQRWAQQRRSARPETAEPEALPAE